MDYKWVLMQEDGTIFEGQGNEKALVTAMKTPSVIDGDICYNGHWNNMKFWQFLLK